MNDEFKERNLEPEDTTFDWPDGATIISEMSNDLANEYIIDEAVNGNPPLITLAVDLAVRGDDQAAAEVLRKIYDNAGDNDNARADWLREKEWAEGIEREEEWEAAMDEWAEKQGLTVPLAFFAEHKGKE